MSSNQPQQDIRARVSQSRVIEIAKDQVSEAATIGQGAIASGSWVFPFRGIFYLFHHGSLWWGMRIPIFYSLVTSIVVTTILFTFTYLPQAAVLSIVNGPIGFITAVPLILSEAGSVVLFISKVFWLGPALDDIFDQVLLKQGMTELVSHGRVVERTSSGKRLGAAVLKPLDRFSKEGIIRYLLTLPLNAIPIVGTVFFVFYNGMKQGPSYHTRYFQLKRFSSSQKAEFVKKHKASYTAFGAASMALNLIPGLSVLFAFSTAVGAALWASDLEREQASPDGTPVNAESSQRGVAKDEL